MRKNVTRRQQNILQYILEYQEIHGNSPTLEEIGQALNITRMTVHEHIKKMDKKGLIRRARGLSRGVTVADTAAAGESGLPLVGSIRAGAPLEAVEISNEKFRFRDLLPSNKDMYVLKVDGDSMIEDGIHDGDYVIVEKNSTAQTGDTIVAIVEDGEATLKRYYPEAGRIRLQPANAALTPKYYDQVEIRGVVRGIYRRI